MNEWNVLWEGKPPVVRKAVLIEGMPGIGNVGKVAIDFLVDALKAKKIAELRSFGMPHSVFVNEHNLLEMPRIELYIARRKGRDVLLLAGDVQPINESSCHAFCELVLRVCKQLNVQEIITTAGIGLRQVPKKPKVYVTGTSKKAVAPFAKLRVSPQLYGTVGPIVGVSGVLCALAGREKIASAALLVEVFGHPMYVAVRGAKELLRVFNAHLALKLNFRQIEKDIQSLEDELAEKTPETRPVGFGRAKTVEDINYIG